MGIRVIKTAVAVWASITLAGLLGIPSPLSAGLLAILGIDVTKKKGLRTSIQRIAASMISLVLSAFLFGLLGFRIEVISLCILILYPVLTRLKLKEGVVTSSVVMFHVYTAHELSAAQLLNEVSLLLVGLGTATVINIIYMPRADKKLMELKGKLEACFSQIFVQISRHLKEPDYIWSGSELLEGQELIRCGLQEAERSKENALFLQDDPLWTVYFLMRKQQMESIDRMIQLVAQVYQTLPHGELLASVFEGLSEDVKVDYYTGRAEKALESLEVGFRQMPLPDSREEFEVRSALLQLMMELKAYLAVAKRRKKQKEAHPGH
ncbi:aromatic acid exporter family protein [Paenibacillus sp. NPDC056579]|uniref:aromatic acid exporter family protein n=1 Tax=unclassified Paenibacillus TaxID=185978 RepID=UPI001EF84442|nr:aromatic acid exporter family protein [Paenibacillus sp. H1-7]ULL15693.1 aromatic acid exporter family protein [Paenibacillus sp. H1-7]